MHKRPLGRTGIDIAPLVFGGNVFGWTANEATSFALLDRFRDAGFDTIDTADAYSAWVPGHKGGESETVIGNWLQRSRVPRDEVVIVSKVGSDMGQGHPDLSKRWILEEIDASLRRLKTDYIDLYLSHWPDPRTPYEETLEAHSRLVEAGKIRAFGASNLDASQLSASLAAARNAGLARYQVLQPLYNLYDRAGFEGELAALCREEEIGVITYYSLASGFLTGKYRSAGDTKGKARGGGIERYLDARGMRLLDALDRASEESGAKPAEIALAWLLAKPAVTAPIASATSLAQLDSLVKSTELKLTDDQIARLDEAGQPDDGGA